MRRLLALISLVLTLSAESLSEQFRDGVPSYSDLYDSGTVGSLKADVQAICDPALLGRKAGSEGEKELAQYLSAELEKAGLDLLYGPNGDVFGINVDGDTLVSRNVAAILTGSDKQLRHRYIVIGARMDHLGSYRMTRDEESIEVVYPGANASASGLACLLALARHIAQTPEAFRKSILLVAFGASEQGCAGSWYFLNRSFPSVKDIDFMVELDALGQGTQGFYAYTASNYDLNRAVESAGAKLQPVKPTLTTQETYPGDHRAFYGSEIPSVVFTTGRYATHNTPRDTPDQLDWDAMEMQLEYLYNFLREQASNVESTDFIEPVAPETPDDQVFGYYECDQPPMFLNSPRIDRFMQEWVYRYLKYPDSAIQEGVQGTVQVSFVIEKDGSVTNVRVARSVDERLDQAAVDVVNVSPKWKAARRHGKKVRSALTLPIEFRLKKK